MEFRDRFGQQPRVSAAFDNEVSVLPRGLDEAVVHGPRASFELLPHTLLVAAP